MTKRRTFIAQISSIVAGAITGVFASPLKTQREVSLNQLRFSHFAQLVGSPFYVLGGVGRMKLQLIEAREAASSSQGVAAVEGDEFSLLFAGAPDQPLEQNTYAFSHPRIGRFLMFIVPVGGVSADDDTRLYQAIFNRPSALASLTP